MVATLGLLVLAVVARAQVVQFTWIPSGPDNNFDNPANWQEAMVPPNDGNARLNLPNGYGEVMILPTGPLSVNSLVLNASYPGVSYAFTSAGATTLTFTPDPGSFGQTSASTGYSRVLEFDDTITVNFATDQYWTASTITFNGAVGGPGLFSYLPLYYYSEAGWNTGYLTLNGPGDFAGGLQLSNVYLYLGHAEALGGGGTLFLNDTRFIADSGYEIDNDISVGGELGTDQAITLSGPMTLTGGTTLSGNFTITGDISETEPGQGITVATGTTLLSGTNTFTGGMMIGSQYSTYYSTYQIPAKVIFENAGAVPDEGNISSNFVSYAGVTFTTGIQEGFIDRLSSEGFQGTIGFDSLGATQTFSETIDLSSLYNPWGIGTSTTAILTGAIITTGGGDNNYRFGGGGGTLTVASNLSGGRDVDVRTPDFTTPTTVIFQGDNSFSDSVNVDSGIAIFDGVDALPSEAGIHLGQVEGSWDIAYAGITENAGLTASQFISRIVPFATQAVVGFDSANPGDPRTVSETIDLYPLLEWRDGGPLYVGTATGVTLEGPILGGANWLGLTGLKGAQLTINTVLDDEQVGSLRIGLGRSPAPDSGTVGLTDEMTGTVRLNGANTFSGGTEWLSGNLVLGHASALGTGTLTIYNDNEDSALTYVGDMTVANDIRFEESDHVGLGSAASIANLTLTGAITGNSHFDGFIYLGAGTLTYAGAASEMGWLEIDAAPGGSVVYQREGGISYGTELGSGNLVIAASTDTMYLATAVGTNVAINAGTTLGLLDNSYSEGTLYHEIRGTLSGAGSLRVEDNGVILSGANTAFSGNILLNDGTVGVLQSTSLGTGTITALGGATSQLVSLGADLNFTNLIVLQGDLEVKGSDSFGYEDYPGLNQDLTLSGIISGAGMLRKTSDNTLTLAGNNTFTGGIYLDQGTLRLTHDHAAGTGTLEFGYYYYGDDPTTAVFTTAAPVIGGLASSSDATVQLAPGSTLTINQATDGNYYGIITGSGASLNKTGAGYLRLTGSGLYDYTGGTTIGGGGIIFDNHYLVADHAAGSITVGAGAYAGLGYNPESGWTDFLTKINATSTGTVGLDYSRTSTESFDLAGLPGVRLGSSTSGTFLENAIITPAGANYLFGGGGGILTVKSVLAYGHGLDLTSPASQPLSLWLRNNNYFTGPMTVTRSAAVFGPGAINDLHNIALGVGGYVGSADLQLAPADFLSHIAPGTNQGIVGFDDFNYVGRSVGGEVNLSAFGSGIFIGTSTLATLRGPLVLPTGSSVYRFAAYKGGTLVVDTELSGIRSVVIGDLNSFGTMRDPHGQGQYSLVVLARNNYYTGGTTLNAGTLRVGAQGLGSGQLLVQANSFPVTEDPVNSLPQLEVIGNGTNLANNIALSGWLRLGGSEQVTLSGTISGSKGLHVYRSDYLPLTLTGTNTYTGGTILESGNVGIGNDAALGTGAITMYHGGLVAMGGPRTLTNPINVATRTEGGTLYLRVGGDDALTLNGPISFESGNAYIQYASPSLPRLPLLQINGNISGDTRLNFDTGGMVWLAGNNTYTGGTNAISSRVIFNSLATLPSEGILTGGYIGLATPDAGLQAGYIDRFGPGYGRTIGFDSIDPEEPQTFAADIDLTGMDHPMLSSATAAILTGTISTDSADYEFTGGGGGILTVASALTGDRGVSLNNPNQPLLVRLTGANTFSGDVVASGLGVIFGTEALPEGAGLVINSSTGGYIGTEDTLISEATFISHFDPLTSHAMIGFDSESSVEPRVVTSPDLSYFTQNSTDIFLGTASRLIIDGTITWPTYNRGMAFAAYRTGWLTVNAELSGESDVLIGNDRLHWSLWESEGGFPTVELAGDNSYTGDTEFYGGQLVLSHANALGSSTLRVNNIFYSDRPVHRLTLNTPIIDNNIDLVGYSYGPNFEITGNLPSTELSGVIAGVGDLTKVGAGTVNLSGANTFGGTLTIAEGIVQFDHATASGAASNTLRFSENGGIAHFTTGNPVIRRLESPRTIDSTVDLDAGVNLTVGNHDSGSPYNYMEYYGNFTGAGSLTKEGYDQLWLYRSSSFSGGTTINQGSIVANNANALGTGAITLNGGDLVLGQGVVINNPISFGGSGGLLSGASTFSGAVTLGADAGLSPGNSPGTMTFGSDLTLGAAAFLDFEIQDPTGLAGSGYDTLVVGNTLYITSSPGSPFVINILSLDGAGNPGALNLSDSSATYSLLLASAGSISGFAPENFILNTSGFSTTLGPNFEFGLLQTGGELRLTFSPVPEPSTYALLGIGALLVGLRRRRARS